MQFLGREEEATVGAAGAEDSHLQLGMGSPAHGGTLWGPGLPWGVGLE